MDNEIKLKHLDFIQSNITRMNNCSIQMKGWAITIIAALLAVYAATINDCGIGKNVFIFIAIVPAALFFFLDSYYLQQERKFRAVYNDVAELNKNGPKIEVLPFEIPLNKYKGWKYSIFKAMLSWTEIPLYGTIIVGLIIAGVLL